MDFPLIPFIYAMMEPPIPVKTMGYKGTMFQCAVLTLKPCNFDIQYMFKSILSGLEA